MFLIVKTSNYLVVLRIGSGRKANFFLPFLRNKKMASNPVKHQCDLLLYYGGAREPPHTSIINGFVVAARPGLLCFCVILNYDTQAGIDEE